jgi:glycosyltransferase involved in cell wall biosynthesis/putative flippase GtrA
MRIGIMMRAIDQDSGFHLYVDGLVRNLLSLQDNNSYVLFYRTSKYFGRFSSYTNATEILIKAPHKMLWDQIAVPYAAWKNKVDIIFNPKITVPFFSHCPVTMGLQEPAWWVLPQFYEKFNAFYQKALLPLYIRKAAHLFPMAKWVVEENKKYINLSNSSVTVTYPGVHEHLKPVNNQKILENFRKKYNLPNKMIISLTRVDNPGMDSSNKWNPGQNAHTSLRAFLLCKDKISHHMVFAGRNVREYLLYRGFTGKDFDRVHFVNFVPFNELQYFYSLADLITLPIYYESFSFTLLGAMACGCPAVVSTTGAFHEVIGDGALYADPHSPEDFADKIMQVLNNEYLQDELKKKSLKRAQTYTWEKTAQDTLKGLYKAVQNNQTAVNKPFVKLTDNIIIQISRCILAGATAFSIDFLALAFLTEILKIYYLFSATIAIILGLSTIYLLNIKWVFINSKLKNKFYEIGLFSLAGIIGISLNILFIWAFTKYIGFHYLISKIISAVMIIMLFPCVFLYRKILYRKIFLS